MDDKDKLLSFVELNKDATASIVLIHGAFGNSTHWNPVAEHLSSFHLLIPDMPGHGLSRKAWPSFSVALASDEIARLVRLHCKGSKARILGLSLGAHVAWDVISRHPDVVDNDAILLGMNHWPEVNKTLLSSIGWFGVRVVNLFPESKEMVELKKTADGSTLPPMPFSYWQDVNTAICSECQPKPWPARTLIVVAGKRGGAPVTDRASTARLLRDAGVKGNAETAAYHHSELIHPWPIFEGKLCADMTLAWIEGRPLPAGFDLMN